MTHIQQLCIFSIRINALGYETTHLVGNDGRYGITCSPVRSFMFDDNNVIATTRSYNEYSFNLDEIVDSTYKLSSDARLILDKWLIKNKANILQLYSKDNIMDAVLYTR